MTKVEKEKMVKDKWPVFSQKNKSKFLKFMEDAPKAKIFDVDKNEHDEDKKLIAC